MRNRPVLLLAAACLGALVIGLAGCKPATTMQSPPFAVNVSDDAGFAQLTARTPLHWPGEEAVFDLTLRNTGNEPWCGRYCVELLTDELPLIVLVQDEVVLQAGEQLTLELSSQLPDDLPYGVYGLALVMPGRFSVIGSLPIGETREASTSSWPKTNCW